MLLVNSAQVPAKQTKNTAGVNVVTLKKNQSIIHVRRAANLELTDPHRYRVRTLPAAGAILRGEDTAEQMQLLYGPGKRNQKSRRGSPFQREPRRLF